MITSADQPKDMRPIRAGRATAVKSAIVGAAAAAALTITPVMAADSPARRPVTKAPVTAAAVYSWSGCYIGGHVGGLWGETEWTSALPNNPIFTPNQDHGYSSAIAGGQIGCNYQVNQIVVGIEGDLSWARVNRETFEDLDDVADFIRTRSDWYGSVRGRLGMAFGQSMFYATGGWAFSNIDLTWKVTTALPSFTTTAHSGWTVGGGWEYALTSNWIGRLEYLYYDFGTHRLPLPFPNFLQDAHPRFHVARVGLSYKFGGAAPAESSR
jgi:outer membrane immunogenic protein